MDYDPGCFVSRKDPPMRTLIKLLGASAVALLALVATPLPANAGVFFEVSGEVSCQADGQYRIDWTYTLLGLADSESSATITVEVVSAELSGAASGSVAFSPDPNVIQYQALDPAPVPTASGPTSVAGATSGAVTLDVTVDVTYDEEGQPPGRPVDLAGTASVTLAGDCIAAPTTAPTTTGERAPARQVAPRLTG
jgi:hypothetical protein